MQNEEFQEENNFVLKERRVIEKTESNVYQNTGEQKQTWEDDKVFCFLYLFHNKTTTKKLTLDMNNPLENHQMWHQKRKHLNFLWENTQNQRKPLSKRGTRVEVYPNQKAGKEEKVENLVKERSWRFLATEAYESPSRKSREVYCRLCLIGLRLCWTIFSISLALVSRVSYVPIRSVGLSAT